MASSSMARCDNSATKASRRLRFRMMRVMKTASSPPARDFSDYVIEIDRDSLPEGVEIIERV